MTKGIAKEDKLWIWPHSGEACSKVQLAKVICRVIESADPGKKPTVHQVRGYASTLAYLRTHNTESVREAGQWASSHSFITRYLSAHLEDVDCVAMTFLPNSNV